MNEVLTERDGSGGSHVLVRELVDHLLQVVDRDLGLIHEDVVVNRASSTLDGGVGAEIEIVLKWMSDILFNESTWESVCVTISCLAVTILGEEADMMTLRADNHGPLDLSRNQYIFES